MDVGPAELLIVLLVVVVLFGGAKLPQLARSLGQAQTEFRRGREEGARSAPEADDTPTAETADPVRTPAPDATVTGDPATGTSELATVGDAPEPDADAADEPPETAPG